MRDGKSSRLRQAGILVFTLGRHTLATHALELFLSEFACPGLRCDEPRRARGRCGDERGFARPTFSAGNGAGRGNDASELPWHLVNIWWVHPAHAPKKLVKTHA